MGLVFRRAKPTAPGELLRVGDTVCFSRDIIGIFDMDTATSGEATKRLLRRNEADGSLTVTGDFPRSFLLLAGDSPLMTSSSSEEGKKDRVILIPQNTGTFLRLSAKPK